MLSKKEIRRNKIKMQIRKKISGNSIYPRVSVFRSNKDIYVQMIDDSSGHTLCATSSRDKTIVSKKGTKTEKAKIVGIELAKKALENKITNAVFDRSGYLYHGRVKALAEGIREGGIKF